ncbi:hypothetical protein I551_1058 [Mycobacterium ulcerans str. Harvey]|uniref:DUF7159 domain-containing protein n=1 Tax=Mycobacterium ulcerans str. Harvey TaxID=1299332 RepID=A0ABN0R5R2_MYCUL|nr:hypothetical protein I551_1058 [Mycobacterium ulcerans str. Harvey]
MALVGAAAEGSAVIDQSSVDLAEGPVAVLTETIVGTNQLLADEGHHLVATRLCWSDQDRAEDLRRALDDSGVLDVAVLSESEAVTALLGPAHAGSAVLLVGEETASLSVLGGGDAPPTMLAAAPVEGDATSTFDTLMTHLDDEGGAPGEVLLVGSSEHTTVIADQFRDASTMRVEVPEDPTFALARGAAMAAAGQVRRWLSRSWAAMPAKQPPICPRSWPRRRRARTRTNSWPIRKPARTSCCRSRARMSTATMAPTMTNLPMTTKTKHRRVRGSVHGLC